MKLSGIAPCTTMFPVPRCTEPKADVTTRTKTSTSAVYYPYHMAAINVSCDNPGFSICVLFGNGRVTTTAIYELLWSNSLT